MTLTCATPAHLLTTSLDAALERSGWQLVAHALGEEPYDTDAICALRQRATHQLERDMIDAVLRRVAS